MTRLDIERQLRLEPKRIASTKKKLESLGFDVEEHRDGKLTFVFNGSTIQFWPYSGWHSGKTIEDGRGFYKLYKQVGGE